MKKLGIAAGIVLVLLGGGLYWVYGHLGALIKRGVETAGPPVTGTEVGLGSARLSIFSGEGALHGLRIGNPKGYSDANAFELSDIRLSVDPKSLTGGPVHVRSLVIDAPRLLAEFDAAGHSNLDAILAHVRGASGGGGGGSGQAGQAGKSGAETRLIVDEFRFVNGQVRARADAYKLDKVVAIPPIELHGLGGKQGIPASQLAAEVMRPVINAAARAALDEYVRSQRGKLVEQGKEKLLDKLFGR
jgi:hypothetical protein